MKYVSVIKPSASLLVSLIIGFSLLSINADAQKISITGFVIDGEDLEDLSGVHVYLERHFGTVTDIDGKFHFQVDYGDTLQFSRVGYDSVSFVVNDLQERQSIFISMKKSTTMLSNVDIGAQYQANTILKRPEKQIYLVPGVKYSDKVHEENFRMGVGGAIGSPMTALYRVFSKRYKEEKKYHEIQKVQQKEEEMFAKASENLYDVLELSDTYLDEYYYRDFIQFSGLTVRYVAESSQYDLLLIIPQAIKQYRVHLAEKGE